MATTTFADPTELGQALAERIVSGIGAARADGRRYVLGCPSGRTPMSTYTVLATLVAERGLDLGHVVIVMMDEYVTRDPGTGAYRRIDDTFPHSCARFGRDAIVAPLSAAAGERTGIGDFRIPDPALPDTYDRGIAELGGIDLFILACGATDGHVAFNPPGSPASSMTRVVELAETTRHDNLGTFPTLGAVEQVPRYGVTVGIDTIRRYSHSAVMVVHGAHKTGAAARLASAEHYDPRWPATVVAECSGAELFLDKAAARS